MDDIIILHFNPIELYPPVQNLLYSFTQTSQAVKTKVLTTHTTFTGIKNIDPKLHSSARIIRLTDSGMNLGFIKRYWSYLFFNAASLIYLMIKRPRTILYYETISSLPAYLYKRFFNQKVGIFIHYHEYTSPGEYNSGMKLNRFFFKREKWLFTKAKWVSHTNDYRMQQFLRDVQPVKITHPHLLPNYPPSSWSRPPKPFISLPVRAVYIGALSLDTMFLKEFTEWLISQKGNILLDIYSFNITEEAKAYVHSLKSEWIKLMPGVNYSDLPGILKDYSLGIVMYKGHIPNYIYNAPNKLFEYLVSGLDVWFPDLMKGSLPYISSGTYPKAVAINFLKLSEYQLNELINHSDCGYNPVSLSCEDIYGPFIEKLIAHD